MRNYNLLLIALFVSALTFGQWKQYNPNPDNDPANASKELLNPTNHTLILIDHQSQMAFAVESQPIEELRNNLGLVSEAAVLYEVPTIVTTIAEKSFSGPVFPEIRDIFTDRSNYIDRSTMNTWEDTRVVKQVEKLGKKKLVIAGLWTEVCVLFPTLSAIEDGYEVYIITDASGGLSQEAHDMSIQRAVQAGARPITSLQYMLEIHRDWARSETYNEIVRISKKYGGSYGLGIDYIKTMSKWLTGKEASEADSGTKN
ncbi:hydrolase [Poritiphilus flavus]|uniref:Isochorismatase family protein n=1 Tax=Poritiphilus flavus TaxID=2697053 RepID=A0A6L9EA14_9FLAO|nr:hydrolase [Poritiphilus flavus]NAS11494.1 isochorismatase family protein [Poritiphilus flavus]